jgi:hypothetical protein
MKATQMKVLIAKVMSVGVVAGALALAGPAKAEAQSWSVGVQFGAPAYGYAAPAYGYAAPAYGPDYYARLRYERERRAAFERRQAWLRQQEWIARERHEAWEREHRYYGGRERDRERDWDRR